MPHRLCGRKHPELGGTPEILDIVGANAYSFGRMEDCEQGPHAALEPDDERIVPLCDMLERVWTRCGRPMLVSETGGLREGSPSWLHDVMQASLVAVNRGIDLHGACLFPAVDMPDWHTGEGLHNGICDPVDDGGRLRRAPFAPNTDALRCWQRLLNRVTELDEDPLRDAAELEDVVHAATRFDVQAERNRH